MSVCSVCNIGIVKKYRMFCSRECASTYHSYKMRMDNVNTIKIQSLSLSEYEKGWLSGLIDGEGCLSLLSSNNISRGSSLRYRTTVEIANTNLNLLNKLRTVCGNVGSIVFKKRYSYTGNRKDSYTYKMPTMVQKQILPELELIVKRRQCEIFQRVWKLLSLTSGGRFHTRVDEINLELKNLKDEVNKLNKRGIY